MPIRIRPLVLAALLAACTAAQASANPVTVVSTPKLDVLPTASEDYLAYSQASATAPGPFGLFVKPTAGPRFRVNPANTNAFVGSIDGTTLVYEQTRPRGKGQIKLFDLVGRTISSPAGVNSTSHESAPALSGDWLVFTRSRGQASTWPRRLVLRNLNTSAQMRLDFGKRAYVQTGGIAGDYVVWTRCPKWTYCNTWIYDIGTDTKRALPNPGKRAQYAASVTADGTVYYAEGSAIFCGPRKRARLWRQPLAGPRELVWTLGRGRDPSVTSAVDLGGGVVDLYFDRYSCRNGSSGISRFRIWP